MSVKAVFDDVFVVVQRPPSQPIAVVDTLSQSHADRPEGALHQLHMDLWKVYRIRYSIFDTRGGVVG